LRASASTTDRRSVLAQLASIFSEAKKHNYVPEEFEARLVAVQVEDKMGSRALAISQLTLLEHDAQAKGFELVAQKAAASRHRL
jgi:hypothetical protein